MSKSDYYTTPTLGDSTFKMNTSRLTSSDTHNSIKIRQQQPQISAKEYPKQIIEDNQEVEDLLAAKKELQEARDFLEQLKVQDIERQILEDQLNELEMLVQDEDFYLHLKYVYNVLLKIGQNRSENVTQLSNDMLQVQFEQDKVDQDVIRCLASQKETLNECTLQARDATEKQISSLEVLLSPKLGKSSLKIQSQMALTKTIQDQYPQLENCQSKLIESSDCCEEKYQVVSKAIENYRTKMCELCVWDDQNIRIKLQKSRYEHLLRKREMMDQRLTEIKVVFEKEQQEATKLEQRYTQALDSAQKHVIMDKSDHQIIQEEAAMQNEVLKIKQQIAEAQNEAAESDRQIVRIRSKKQQQSQMQLFTAVVVILLISFVFFNYC